jgi:hypothetical protein
MVSHWLFALATTHAELQIGYVIFITRSTKDSASPSSIVPTLMQLTIVDVEMTR